MAVKNNIDVFYFSCQYPISMLFVEDGKMGEWPLARLSLFHRLEADVKHQLTAPSAGVHVVVIDMFPRSAGLNLSN